MQLPGNLAGVKVLHGVDKVLEGGAVVLTLKDQSILADGDVNEGKLRWLFLFSFGAKVLKYLYFLMHQTWMYLRMWKLESRSRETWPIKQQKRKPGSMMTSKSLI